MPLKGGLQTGGNPARDGRFSPCSAQSRFCNPRRRPALDLSRFCSHDGECTGSVMVRATGRAEQESPRSGALLLSRSAASGENPPTGIIAAPLFASGTTWRGASKGRTALAARLPHEAQTSENQAGYRMAASKCTGSVQDGRKIPPRAKWIMFAPPRVCGAGAGNFRKSEFLPEVHGRRKRRQIFSAPSPRTRF